MDKKPKKMVPEVRFKGFTDDWEQRKFETLLLPKNGIRRGPFGSALRKDSFVPKSEESYAVYEQRNAIYNKFDVRYYISSQKYNQLSNFHLHTNDVIMSGAGTIGKLAKVPLSFKKGVYNQALIRFQVNKGIDVNYFLFFMKTPQMQKQLTEANPGSAMVNLVPMKELKKWDVIIPSKDEQIKIASLIIKVDRLLSLQQKKLEQLKLLKKAMLQQLFVSDKNNLVPNIRFKGFMYPWKQQKLGDVGKTQSGIGFPNKEQGGQQGIPFFKVSDMNNNENEFEMKDANNYVTETQITNRKWKPISEVPALIFAKVGAALMLNRKRLVNVPFLIDNNTMAYIFSKEWNPHFGKNLFDTLNLPRYAQTGALPSFNGSDIENIEVMLPSLKEQHVISQFFKNINYLITLHQRKIHTLSNLKKFCLQKMFI